METFTAYDTTSAQLLTEASAAFAGVDDADAERRFMETGLLPLKIISPGWGTSAYYSADALAEAAQRNMFPMGTKMFWDHPSLSEKVERPERSLRDLAGTFEEAARWESQGPRGPGLYTKVKVRKEFREPIWELRKHIGPSIRAYGNTYFGEAEGKQGPIVESIIAAESVDFVTAPGRGGEIIQLFEAARPAALNGSSVGDVHLHMNSSTPTTQENEVELQEAQRMVADRERELTEAHNTRVTSLEETIRTLTTERDEARGHAQRLQEAFILREAKDTVAEALRPVTNLPDITKNRLIESVSFNPPMTDKGELDKPALATKLQEAVKSEAQYLAQATGSGRPFGLGATNAQGGALGGGTPDQFTTQLEEALRDGFGLDDKAAKSAAGVTN